MGVLTSAWAQHALLKGWHAWLAGSFLVAYLTADEDTYAMHQFAGYAVLAAIVARLAGGLLASAGSPLRLPRPGLKQTLSWLSSRLSSHKGRHPLFAWFAVALLLVVGLAALSGAVADGAAWMEHPHEAISEASLWVILGHIAFVTWMYAGRKGVGRIASRLAGMRLSSLPKDDAR